MLFGVLLMTPFGLQAGLVHMLYHAVMKMSLFLCAGAFIHRSGKNYIFEINGAGRKMPVTFICYTMGALSLSGIPLFAGFVSKWNLLLAGAAVQNVWGLIGTVCLVVAAFFCAIYTLTISARAFFPVKGTDLWEKEKLSDPGWKMLVPISLFAFLDLALGMCSGPVLEFLDQVSKGVI